jgi:phosphoenolpyruvate phosphomutase / 2-hydroxyethylphosphonate cytidylyltransferase
MNKSNKTIYLGLSADVLHHGHVNIINKASKYGKLIIGLMTDKAIIEKKKIPILTWHQRYNILKNFNGVNKIIPQEQWDYSTNLLKVKPDFFIHGDDWKFKNSYDFELRKKVLQTLKKIKCKLIEIPHTKNISSSIIFEKMKYLNKDLSSRTNTLKRIIETKKFCRIIEAHSPLSALITENLIYREKNGQLSEFDGFWSSSLTDSTLKGKPDIEVVELNQRLNNISEILDVTTKPLIMDGDTGGKPEHFEINIKSIERMGVSAVIIEDKKGLKKNSLLGTSIKQEQENIKTFSEKIKIGKKSATSDNLMLIARIESFILNKGLNDALKRANSYVNAGVDGIMIHSKSKTPQEILKFADKFKKKYPDLPLVAVPTSYNKTREKELVNAGVNIVIYANHLLRASYPAMTNIALEILKNKRSFEAEKKLLSINKILRLIPGTI